MADRSFTAKLVAESVGTFALIYIGVLAIAHLGGSGGSAGLVGIALAHGLTIAALASATMMVSGGHLNPAVTFGAWVGGKIKGQDALSYVLAQLAGGLAGGLLAQISLSTMQLTSPVGVPSLAPSLAAAGNTGLATGILIEAILTFLLVFVVYGTGIDSRFGGRLGGLAIGLTVTLDILAGGPLTGAAMNPARWFGAAVPAGFYDNAIVYIVGPLLGAGAAGLLYSRVVAERPST